MILSEREQEVFDFINVRGFAAFCEVKEKFDFSKAATKYVLNRLLKNGFIFRRKAGVYVVSEDVPDPVWDCLECGENVLPDLNVKKCRKCFADNHKIVLSFIAQNGKASVADMRNAYGFTSKQIERILKRLLDKNLIYRDSLGVYICLSNVVVKNYKRPKQFCSQCGAIRTKTYFENHVCVDWLAIEQAFDNKKSPKELNRREMRLMLRKFTSKLWHKDPRLMPINRVTLKQLSSWAGVKYVSLENVYYAMPLAHEHVCPICAGTCWVIAETGLVEDHANGYLRWCKMSGQRWA